jgi:phage terminase large subunit
VTNEQRDQVIRERFRRWRWFPESFVREEFQVEPDAWQLEALRLFPRNQRLALKACKGPGKTAALAWMILNFLATRPHPRIAAVSITGDNLASNLWPELSKWMARSTYLSSQFAWTKTQVVHRRHYATWWCQARSWAKQADAERQADALAGLHADYAMAVLDESGGIPQSVMATAEAVLASGIETKVLQAGNPTHTTGPLYRACVTDRHLWKVVTITGDPDRPDRSPRISLKWAREQIDSYGRDNPWVMVNVLGEFPPSSINSLLGVEDVERAMRRHLREDAYDWAQKRLGVDVARFGDDRTVIFPRQGLAAFRPVVLRQQRSTTIAARVAMAMDAWGAETVLIDDTGHWGHGAVDLLTTAGRPVFPVIASDPATDKRYRTMRDQMWAGMAEWVKKGGALPNIPELVRELTEPTYTFLGGKFLVESKDLVKQRLGSSPDLADALAQTFALPDAPAAMMPGLQGRSTALHEFNPFEVETDRYLLDAIGKAATEFDPFA